MADFWRQVIVDETGRPRLADATRSGVVAKDSGATGLKSRDAPAHRAPAAQKCVRPSSALNSALTDACNLCQLLLRPRARPTKSADNPGQLAEGQAAGLAELV